MCEHIDISIVIYIVPFYISRIQNVEIKQLIKAEFYQPHTIAHIIMITSRTPLPTSEHVFV